MAYDTKELEKQAVEAINQHKLFFVDDIVSYLPCSRATFYDKGLDKSDAIKEALLKVKTDIKVSMRSKWYNSESAVLQVALMKLIATDEERKRIAQQYSDVTTDGNALPSPILGGMSVQQNDSPAQDSEA